VKLEECVLFKEPGGLSPWFTQHSGLSTQDYTVLIKLFALRLSITFLIQARFGSPRASVLIFSGLRTQHLPKCFRPTQASVFPVNIVCRYHPFPSRTRP
jgi:hypothetical protein